MTVTISDRLQKYCEQLKNLNQITPDNNPKKDDEVRVILYDISL